MIRDTNFLDELYTDDELNAENIKDRDGKMKFLQKLIDVVSECPMYLLIIHCMLDDAHLTL